MDIQLNKNLESVQRKIKKVCALVGKPPNEIELVVISKKRTLSEIKKLQELGITNFGENQITELKNKKNNFATTINWHFIGNIEPIYCEKIVKSSDVIHTIDNLDSAKHISFHAFKLDKYIKIYLKTNLVNNYMDRGFNCLNWEQNPNQIEKIIKCIEFLKLQKHILINGLMTVVPIGTNEIKTREIYKRNRELSYKIIDSIPDITSLKLSMGVSHDFEIAIEEGADVIRLGSIIFK